MKEHNSSAKKWWTKHKKKISAISTFVVIGGISYILLKNKDLLISLQNSEIIKSNCTHKLHEETITKAVGLIKLETIADDPKVLLNGGEPFPVKQHIRNLGENRYPSAEKISIATACGIVLSEHQTLVEEYLKNQNVA